MFWRLVYVHHLFVCPRSTGEGTGSPGTAVRENKLPCRCWESVPPNSVKTFSACNCRASLAHFSLLLNLNLNFSILVSSLRIAYNTLYFDHIHSSFNSSKIHPPSHTHIICVLNITYIKKNCQLQFELLIYTWVWGHSQEHRQSTRGWTTKVNQLSYRSAICFDKKWVHVSLIL